jgi:signal peptidase I
MRLKRKIMSSSQATGTLAHSLECELAADVLRSSGKLRLPAVGRSMVPTIWPGDTLTIERTNIEDVCQGDIALFVRHGRLVAHRVMGKNSGQQNAQITTQGDGMCQPDAPITNLELLGKVRLIMRNGKRIEPRVRLGFSKRVVAALVQRSSSAARVIVGVHGMRRTQQKLG